mgnify:CR=1 FL=1
MWSSDWGGRGDEGGSTGGDGGDQDPSNTIPGPGGDEGGGGGAFIIRVFVCAYSDRPSKKISFLSYKKIIIKKYKIFT